MYGNEEHWNLRIMVNDVTSGLIEISKFPYAWRITDPRWDRLPDDILQCIHPLSDARSQRVAEHGELLRYQGPYALRAENYHVIHETSLIELNPLDSGRIENWLSGLTIKPDEDVYVSWVAVDPPQAVITSWGVLVKTWSSLWYPFDVVNIFDDSLIWAVLLGPEEFAVYVEAGGATEPSSDDVRLNAYGLVRATRK